MANRKETKHKNDESAAVTAEPRRSNANHSASATS